MPKYIEEKLKDAFTREKPFSRKELFDFFRIIEPDLNKNTFTWRIYDLKKKEIITPLSMEYFIRTSKPKYRPVISGKLFKLSKDISNKFSDIMHCVWDTNWLNEFSLHQVTQSKIIIEIEKEFTESLYFYLKDSSIPELFIDPESKEIDLYISESEHPVIIKNLITRSPINSRARKGKVSVPLLEKILVDIFAEEKLFQYLQGSELNHIYETAIKKYQMNFSTLLNYANRRGKEKEIREYLKSHLPQQLNVVIS